MPDIVFNQFCKILNDNGIKIEDTHLNNIYKNIEALFIKSHPEREETMTRGLIRTLLKILDRVHEKSENIVSRKELNLTHSEYTNLARLRYWGLIHHPVDSDGDQIDGEWLLTRNAGHFLRGEIAIPLTLIVQNNRKILESKHRIFIDEYESVLKDYWITCKEYRERYKERIQRQQNLNLV